MPTQGNVFSIIVDRLFEVPCLKDTRDSYRRGPPKFLISPSFSLHALVKSVKSKAKLFKAKKRKLKLTQPEK